MYGLSDSIMQFIVQSILCYQPSRMSSDTKRILARSGRALDFPPRHYTSAIHCAIDQTLSLFISSLGQAHC